jgi:endonuclease YncB( thermonuclease family)
MSPIPRAAGIAASLLAIGVLWGLVTLFTPSGALLTGRATAVDGDTLRLAGSRVRLVGLDAPELDQSCTRAGESWPCGTEARAFVAGLIDGRDTACTPAGRDRYRRILAHCRVGDRDLGEAIVAAGWAVPDLEYALAAAPARASGTGIWAGPFESPAQWRRDRGEGSLLDWLLGWFE